MKYLWDKNISSGSRDYKGIKHITVIEDAQYFTPDRLSNRTKLTSYIEDIALLLRGISKNIKRRHDSKAQRCKLGLKILEKEKELAKIRKKKTYLAGKGKNNLPIKKSSVGNAVVPTEKNNKKGRALKIAAKIVEVDSKTLSKYAKITEAAKKNEEIKKKLVEIDQNKNTIGKVYRTNIAPKKKLKIIKYCKHFRAAPCPKCYTQIIACNLDLREGKLILRKGCPEVCNNFKE